jgi:hypothetical protein
MVEANFILVMSAYVTPEFQQNQVITKEILSPVLLKRDLVTPPDRQVYVLSRLPTGEYIITPEGIKK